MNDIIAVSNSVESKGHCSQAAWPAAIACILFFAATLLQLRLYSAVHWQVIFHHYAELGVPLKEELFQVLTLLESFRIFGIASLIFGVWSFWLRPRWLAYFCIPVGLFAFVLTFAVM